MGVTEVAAALKVDRSTIHRRILRKELRPASYAGRQPLFTHEDVERLMRGEQQLPMERDR